MANKNIVKGDIGNALHSVAPDHIVTTSDEVFDETLQMYQNEINFLDGVFDISAYNLTDGQPTKYADLTAALGTNGANVPEQYRVPGMTIRYVQSSDNKYVQYRLVSDSFNTTPSNWQKSGAEVSVSQNTLTIGDKSYEVATDKVGLLLEQSTDYRKGYVNSDNGGIVSSNTRLTNNFPISYKIGAEEIIALGNYWFYVCLYDESYLSYVGFICEDGTLTTDTSKQQMLMNHFDLSAYPNYFAAITIRDADNLSAEISPSQGVNILIGYNRHQEDYALANTTKAEIEQESIEETLYQFSANRLISKTYDRVKDAERLKKFWLGSNTQSIIVWCKNSIWDSNTIVSDWITDRSFYQGVLSNQITSYTYFGFYFKNNNDSNLSPSDVDFYYNTILYKLTHREKISLSWFISSGSYVKSRLCTIAYRANNATLLKDYWLSNDFEYEMNLIESHSTDLSQGGTSLTGWTNKRAVFVAALGNITKQFIFIFFRKLRNANESINSEDVLWLEYRGEGNEILNTLNKVDTPYSLLKGKTFAVMCDSIGTHGNSGLWHNVAEVVIGSADVGVELKAYLTHYDLYSGATQQDPIGTYTGLTIGGVSFTEDQIGTEITFTPTADDIGKSVGKVYDWNGNDMDVWWVNLAKKTGMTPIPVCWASSSYSSHESSTQRLKTAHAWHDAQIRKCGVRVEGTMTRLAPDYIILARGCNDMTHEPYDRLTSGFYDDVEWDFPATDVVESDGYGLKEAISLTIKKLWAAYPYAKIILCTIPYVKRIDYDNFPTNNDTEQSPLSYASNYCQWNDAIRETADFFGCGLIDFSKDGITHQNLLSFTADNVHPNTAGHALMGLEACKAFII